MSAFTKQAFIQVWRAHTHTHTRLSTVLPSVCVRVVARALLPCRGLSTASCLPVVRGGASHAQPLLDQRAYTPKFQFNKKSNIVLMGPPGSGKSSVGRLLASQLSMPFVDIDDDWLEPQWGCTVAAKLKQLGDDAFLQAEGETLCKFNQQNTVVSLSGSNPLHAVSMEQIAKDGIVVYLDVEPSAIVARCERMKVDRIVGQATKTLANILQERRKIYENSYNIRIMVEENEAVDSIVSKIRVQLRNYVDSSYVSTRGHGSSSVIRWSSIVSVGLSPDRGLFLPRCMEGLAFTRGELERLVPLSYQERVIRVIERFNPDIHIGTLRRIVYKAYQTFTHTHILPISHLSIKTGKDSKNFHSNMYLMETYHGPTASFKDLSLQLLPLFLEYARNNSSPNPSSSASTPDSASSTAPLGLLVATSGDTGTAALHAFTRHTRMPVIVLYPHQGVSVVQQQQMQTSEGDVCIIGVKSDFDFCQRLVKDVFNTPSLQAELKQVSPITFTSANSMNWGRFLPQIVFSISAYVDMVKRFSLPLGSPIDVVIPTGNFGNILGCYMAKKYFKLPIQHIVCASNNNNILFDFLTKGVYDITKRQFHTTVSPSIDILVSSNLERFLYLLSDGDTALVSSLFQQLERNGHFRIPDTLLQKMKSEMSAGWADEQQCIQTIQQTYQLTGRFIDPHTAVAVHVANSVLSRSSRPILVSSTAHWAKFPPTMLHALHANNKLQANDLAHMFQALRQFDETEYEQHMHPLLESLAHAPIRHKDVCEGSVKDVMERIKRFLVEYEAKKNKLSKERS